MLTYYVVQSFRPGHKGYLIPDEAQRARSEGQARLLAARLADERAGVVAFSRTGDPSTGVYDDARIICQFGLVPEMAMQMVS